MTREAAARTDEPLTLLLDNYDVAEFSTLAVSFANQRFGFVVTPNVDQVIRYREEASFRALYAQASYVLLDSRFLAHTLRLLKHIRARTCPGSDLTPALLSHADSRHSNIVLVGGSSGQASQLASQYQLAGLTHIQPPMGFIESADEIEECLEAIEAASPFRYCFLAVGSPQQELVAAKLRARGRARGLALCVGASINFLTGAEVRAPSWMRRAGLEWFFRLAQSPLRLGHRYLIRGPRIFWVLKELRIELRRLT